MATSKSSTPLRFGALIRVSTERQEQKGESLRVQKKQIEVAVENLGGKIVGWYGGAEHATPGYEKAELGRLLADAQKGRFDAFICSDPDRWSRDNETSERGLEVLRDAGVRFFVQDVEHDLFDPNDCLFLGVSAVIGRFFAANQKRKSLNARIEKAKRGCCVCGNKPWGRTWNKDTETWTVDAKRQAQIEDIAKRYLAGESLPELAKEIGMAHASIYQVLRDRCGDEWRQVFHPNKRSQRDKGEPVVTTVKVPPLLPEETIKAIRAKMQANRTYSHGPLKNAYLLSRMVFCQHCGSSLSGETQNRKKDRYYRHLSRTTEQKIGKSPCENPHSFIPADEIEELVLLHLFECFGNPKAVQEAVEKASGDVEKVMEYQGRLSRTVSELEKIEKGRQRILDLVVKDAIGQGQAETKLQDLKDREGRLQEEQSRLADFLSGRPNQAQIKDASEKVSAAFRKYRPGSWKVSQARLIAGSKPFSKMSWEEKRALCEMVFSGKTVDGKRMGVYVKWNGDGKDWTFSIHGHLIDLESTRWSESHKQSVREDLDEGLGGYRQSELLSKRTKSAYR